MQESRTEMEKGEGSHGDSTSETELKLFVEKVKDDILSSIENATPDEILAYRESLSPEALEFFDSKDADPTAAQMRHFAIFSVLDRLTPDQVMLIRDGVTDAYSPILHDLKNVIFMHQSIREIVEMGQSHRNSDESVRR